MFNTALNSEIEKRAFEIYVKRGKNPGNHLDDWLRAEKEILFNNKSKTKSRNSPQREKMVA